MSDIYGGFGQGPIYQGADPNDQFAAAFDMPMNMGATFWDQAKGGVLESFGLGTELRRSQIPEGDTRALSPGERIARDEAGIPNPLRALRRLGQDAGLLSDEPDDTSAPLTQDQWKSSAYFRENIPWDASMTEARAEALAQFSDAKRVREYFGSKRPITSFFGNMAGQAVDPINYIPVMGAAVKEASILRMALVGAADAASNTAVFGVTTRDARERFGDDVSWQATVSDIATAALIGGAFGGIAGAFDRLSANKASAKAQADIHTLKTTQEARIALNEAIDAVANGGDVRLSPNAGDVVQREMSQISAAYDDIRRNPSGPTNDPLVRIMPEDIDGTILARGAFKDINEVEISRRGWGLVKILWRHGDESNTPPAFRIAKEDVVALPEVVRNYEPSSVSEDGGRREWRTERNGRTVVYADTLTPEGRHVVTAYVQSPRQAGAELPLSKKKEPDATGSSSDALNAFGDTDRRLSLRASDGLSQPAQSNIDRRFSNGNSSVSITQNASSAVGKSEDIRSLAQQQAVDPKTGDFPEIAEVEQLRAEGRLTEDDLAELADADVVMSDADAYANAFQAVTRCLL